jgi:hypothetical protein
MTMDSFEAALLASFGVDLRHVPVSGADLTIDTFDNWTGSTDAEIQPTTFCQV